MIGSAYWKKGAKSLRYINLYANFTIDSVLLLRDKALNICNVPDVSAAQKRMFCLFFFQFRDDNN